MDGLFFIEMGSEILSELLKMLITLAGTWLLLKMAGHAKISSIAKATQNVVDLSVQTVDELEQTLVASLRSAHEDGKLDENDVALLNSELLGRTMNKMSDPVKELLEAAKTDIVSLILGAGESWIHAMKAVASDGEKD